MKNKHNAKSAYALVNGEQRKFPSKMERDRYLVLHKLQKEGKISKLALQPRFVLKDGYTILRNGKKSKRKNIVYTPDFYYIENGLTVIEEVKGQETEAYRLRRSLFLYDKRNGINPNSEILHVDIFREFKKDEIIDWR